MNKKFRSAFQENLNTIYDQARRHVIHEDDLVDRRLKWAITVSGFLFAAYGATWIAFPKEFPLKGDWVTIILCAVQSMISVFGYLASKITIPSIHAAHMAIRAITRKYNNFIEENEDSIRRGRVQVWKLIGDKITHAPGFHSSLYIPYELSAIWVVIGMLSIAIGFYPALKMFDLVLLYPFVLVPLALVAAIWITRLFKAAKSLRVELEETAEESKTVKQLREMGITKHVSIISEDSFLLELEDSYGDA